MSKRASQHYLILLPILLGSILLFIPLVGDLHIESALLVALLGCFWGAISACKKDNATSDFFSALHIAGFLYLVGVPLLIYAFVTGCFSVDGLAFWLLFPLPSVFFGYAIGRLLRMWNVPGRRLISISILFLIGIGILIYEFFTYPQVYFFNHVWGGWPGPIYDEVIKINSSTVFYRILTSLWSLLLWHIPIIQKEKYAVWIVMLSALAIAFSYTQLTERSIITPRSYLQNELQGHKQTKHFELYYNRRLYSNYEINLLADEHEFYLEQISQRLSLPKRDSNHRIESYLYGHPWQKKKLVGAKFTSYVPVWLQQDQLHIAKQQIAGSLKHELVHVLAKQFGNNLIHASWSIGLVEGLAVATAGSSSMTSTIDQIVASEKPYPNAIQLQGSFSPAGFYGGRSGVNYITSGSFVRYLLDNYPAKLLKEAYKTATIDGVYPDSWQTMARGWHRHLDSVTVDSVDQQIASLIFSIPSLFEQECPHKISDFERALDQYRYHQANHDSTEALRSINKAVAEADSLAPIKAEWIYSHLLAHNFGKVQQVASLEDTTVDLQLLYADAFALQHKWKQANSHISQAQKLYALKPDSLLKPALATRKNSRQWHIYRQMTYFDDLPDSTIFARADYRTRIRSLQKVIKKERWQLFQQYGMQLVDQPAHEKYFDDYLLLIHQLAFQQNYLLAKRWIRKLSAMSLRARYNERLKQEVTWLEFLARKRMDK